MSLNKFTNVNTGKDIGLTIGCSTLNCTSCVCETMVIPNGGDLTAHSVYVQGDLTVETTNGDLDYLTPDRGNNLDVLHTDGLGNTYWAPDATGVVGILYDGTLPSVVGNFAKYSDTAGDTVDNSLLTETGGQLFFNSNEIKSFDQDLNTTDAATFAGLTLNNDKILLGNTTASGGINDILIGNGARSTGAGGDNVNIGLFAGNTSTNQQENVHIGVSAGFSNTRPYGLALGSNACTNGGNFDKTICINSSNSALDPTEANQINMQAGTTTMTVSTGGLVVNNDNVFPAYRTSSTGILAGGILSLVGAPDASALFDISAGEGIIVDPVLETSTYVTWAAKLNQSAIYTGILTYVSLDLNANVVYSNTAPTNENYRDLIFLGILVHIANPLLLTGVNNEHVISSLVGNQLHDLFEALGFLNLSGNLLTAPSTNLSVSKSSGVIFAHGANYITNPKDPHYLTIPAIDTSGTGIFQYRFRNGTSSALTLKLLIPGIIDDGSNYPAGTVLGVNKWQAQRVYVFTSGVMKIQPGQNSYNSANEAITSVTTSDFIIEPSINENGLLVGYIVIRGGALDTSLSTDCQFYAAGKFGSSQSVVSGGSSTLQDAYNNSGVEPEILTDSTRLALTLKRGSGADTDNLIEIGNGAGTTTASINGNGLITATNITTSDINISLANANAPTTNSINIGNNATSTAGGANSSVSIGKDTVAGQVSCAIVDSAEAGGQSVAIGYTSKTNNNGVSIGHLAGSGTNTLGSNVCIGTEAGVSNSNWEKVVCIGARAGVSDFNSNNSIYIGFDANNGATSVKNQVLVMNAKTTATVATADNQINLSAGTTNLTMDALGMVLGTIQTFADEAAAVTGGVATNTIYKTVTGELRIKL